jgi:hypothetical protein
MKRRLFLFTTLVALLISACAARRSRATRVTALMHTTPIERTFSKPPETSTQEAEDLQEASPEASAPVESGPPKPDGLPADAVEPAPAPTIDAHQPQVSKTVPVDKDVTKSADPVLGQVVSTSPATNPQRSNPLPLVLLAAVPVLAVFLWRKTARKDGQS